MNYASYYAQALFALVEEHAADSQKYLENLKRVLVRRGHQKLLPNICVEYKKLALRKERFARYGAVTPEKERTRILLELYRRLVATE